MHPALKMAVTGKTREIFPQTLKGLCIICVVLIHLPWGQSGEWTEWLWISVRQVINFAVATFFFLSAYYTKPIESLDRTGILTYYRNRLQRLLIPYLIWASVYILVIPLATTGKISEDWGYYFLTGKGPTYFLLALAQFTLLNPVLQRYKNNQIWNALFIMVTPLYLVFYYSYNIKYGVEFKPEQFFCFPWFACYYLGLKFQDASVKKKAEKFSPLSVIALCMILLLASIVEACFIYSSTGLYSFAISQITAGSILYSIGVIILFKILWTFRNVEKRCFLTSLGDFSMGIFLMHPTFNWIFKYISLHIPGGIKMYSTDWGFLTIHVIVLALSVASSYYASKFISITYPILSKPLGLK